MMNHQEARKLLDAYVDGDLGSGEARRVEAHLAACDLCRDELSRLGALLDAVTALREREAQPGRDLWPDIRDRVLPPDPDHASLPATPAAHPATRATARRSGRMMGWLDAIAAGWRSPLAAGALALLILAGGYSLHVWRQSNRPPARATGVSGVDAAASHADQARAELEKLLQERGQEWPANTGSVLQQNLLMLDQAIRDSRAALEANPQDRGRQRSLLAIYQKQLDLLRWATRLVQQT